MSLMALPILNRIRPTTPREPSMRIIAAAFVLLFASLAVADDGFVPLFNHKNLGGWKERQVAKGQEGRWSAVDGILYANAGSGWLGTEKQYGDFVLRVGWKI